jgi:chemotaxis signal transduction protein
METRVCGVRCVLEVRRQALIFLVGEHRYAMDILHLREVGRLPHIEPEPGAPAGVLGVARLHGEPVRVLALAPLLGEVARPAGPGGPAGRADGPHPWLIVSRETGGDRHWLVDGVQDIVEYDPAGVRHHASSADGPKAAGILEVDGQLTYLLTPELLAWREGAA